MLLLQRPPSFLRSCWAAWTSWLKNTQETQAKSEKKQIFTCLDVDRLYCFFHTDIHLPHRLSLSLTASCVFSSAANSSLRCNGESEHFRIPLQPYRECARWFVELFYFQCLVQKALWKQLSEQSETPATSCMWCANGSQTRSRGSSLHWRSAWAYFTLPYNAQAKSKTFSYVRYKLCTWLFVI